MAGRTTLGRMLQWIETPFQTTVSRERDMLVANANKIRRIFYDAYREFELEVDIEECFAVQEFGHCAECPDDTKGVTLPPYMQNVEAAWSSFEPLSMFSKWREYKVGQKQSKDVTRATYDMPGRYCTERELCPSGELHCVQLLAKSPEDEGKIVRVSYQAAEGRRDEHVTLTKGAYKRLNHKASKIHSVVLPVDLRGGITIAQDTEEDGIRILSEYQPWEHVPSYKRVKVTGVGCDEVVVLRASRQYTDLYYDDDIVETDNRIAIEHAARYLFYSESGTGSELLQKAAFHLQSMKDALLGMSSRDKSQRQDDSFLAGPPVKRSRLRRHRRSHTIR